MKLVSISHVIKDEKFLVEVIENQSTLEALSNTIEDRGANPSYTCNINSIRRLPERISAGI